MKEYRISVELTAPRQWVFLYVKSYDNDTPLHFPANDETGTPETVEIGKVVLTFEEPVEVEEWPLKR